MATYGIEAIRHFGNARANDVSEAEDLTYTFNRSNGFNDQLAGSGHTREFFWADQNCWENDIQDTSAGGDDRNWVDNVDIFWIETHGNHEGDGQARMLYDIPRDEWRTFSGTWRLGDNWNAEWVMAYSCKTAALATITGLWNIFAGLHLYCGAYDNMYDGVTTDECGEDVGDNLTDGDTVSSSWIDGVRHVGDHRAELPREGGCVRGYGHVVLLSGRVKVLPGSDQPSAQRQSRQACCDGARSGDTVPWPQRWSRL